MPSLSQHAPGELVRRAKTASAHARRPLLQTGRRTPTGTGCCRATDWAALAVTSPASTGVVLLWGSALAHLAPPQPGRAAGNPRPRPPRRAPPDLAGTPQIISCAAGGVTFGKLSGRKVRAPWSPRVLRKGEARFDVGAVAVLTRVILGVKTLTGLRLVSPLRHRGSLKALFGGSSSVQRAPNTAQATTHRRARPPRCLPSVPPSQFVREGPARRRVHQLISGRASHRRVTEAVLPQAPASPTGTSVSTP